MLSMLPPARKLPPREALAELFDYDPAETGIFRWKPRDTKPGWNTAWAGKVAGGKDKDGYIQLQIGGKLWKAHRVAWALVHGEIDPRLHIDHANGDPADNRIANLRLATRAQNQYNMRGHKDATYPKGVYKVGARYYARICRKGKTTCLGGFATPEEAHAEYVRAAQVTFGAFAREQ